MAYKMEVSLDDILKAYGKNRKVSHKSKIKKAYEYALGKHEGVFRGTGEPYIQHPMRVALMLAEWGLGSDFICAALTHDIVEDCDTPLSEIEKKFGPKVADMVDAVTALSDKDFTEKDLTKAQKDLLSDAHLQKKMNDKALYVKIADRLDNLNTLSGVPEEKRIPKATHTREIIVPMAIIEKAWHFVDLLENLCYRTENPDTYYKISEYYQTLCQKNNNMCRKDIEYLTNIFDPHYNTQGRALDPYHKYISNFLCDKRSPYSIFRQLNKKAKNVNDYWESLFTKDYIELYNLTLIVSDQLSEENADLKPSEVFMGYFGKVLSPNGFFLTGYKYTSYSNTGYFVITDEMDNSFRFFIRTEKSYRRFLYGNIVDKDSSFKLNDVNEIDPRDTYNEKIKVFLKNGKAMYIDKHATVLDFAFQIHSDIGIHFDYAMINGSKAKYLPYTRLQEGDKVVIVTSPEARPDFNWIKYVNTSKAKYHLARYFGSHYVYKPRS